MTSRLAELRQKSKLRREYLKVTLGVDNLSEALGSDVVEPTCDKTRNSNNGDWALTTNNCLLIKTLV